MKKYNFYGSEIRDIKPINPLYNKIENQRHLYECLLCVWSRETCAPRLRDEWSEDNKTCGQCSITAFLVQDIFGGDVLGVLRPGGNYHCFNKIGDVIFDLTSEQFGNEKLDYLANFQQNRETHFLKEEKRLRYEKLKSDLEKFLQD